MRSVRKTGRSHAVAWQYRQHERNSTLRMRIRTFHSSALWYRLDFRPADYSRTHVLAGSHRVSRHTYGRHCHDGHRIHGSGTSDGRCRYNSCSTADMRNAPYLSQCIWRPLRGYNRGPLGRRQDNRLSRPVHMHIKDKLYK